MATVVIMPKQGQSVESCIITEIGKRVGDRVTKGDLLFAYETDKASFEEFAATDGVVLALFYSAGDEVPVLKEVCVIGEEGESFAALLPDVPVESGAPATTHSAQENRVEESESTTRSYAGTGAVTRSADQMITVSPRARLLAEREGLPLELIPGSGPQGRIIERDVILFKEQNPRITPLARAVASESGKSAPMGTGLNGTVRACDLTAEKVIPAACASDFEIEKLSNIRKLIARSMHQSLQNSAQLTHHLSADARRLLQLRKEAKAAGEKGSGKNITLNDLICYGVILALKKFPRVNSHFLGDSMKLFKGVHLGFAVDTDRGLMVPVIRNADQLTLGELSEQFRDLADKCRKGAVDPDLLSPEAASFTVSNLGNYGVEMFTPVINLPQSAILGVNTILPRPKELGDGVYAFVPHLGLSLTYNHQSLDGGEATRFLKQIATEIENLTVEI